MEYNNIMAIFDGEWIYGEYRFSIWMDPKRYRGKIWSRHYGYKYYTNLVKVMYDKDRDRLVTRAREWMDNNPLPVAKSE